MTRQPVARREDLWEGEMAGLQVGDTPVLLVNVSGTIHAYEDRCPHRGVRLSRGRLDGETIVCGAHDWSYDACTGRGINPRSVTLCPLVVSVEGEEIFVDLASTRSGRAGPVAERVGPVLQAGPAAEAVVAAIRYLNEDVQVLDRGAYLRVLVPGCCVLTRAAVEAELGGAPFKLPGDLERLMPSFKGRLAITEDSVRWEA